MVSYVLSVLGDDRSGLVEALSAVVARHGGNWDRSHMTQLAGKFAGLVLVAIPDREVDGFLADLAPLETQGLFDIAVEAAQERAPDPEGSVQLDLVGTDHPGIVHELAQLLASLGVSFDDLQTWTSDAPMAGGALFHAKAVLRLPSDLVTRTLIAGIEDLAADLMVDIEVIEDISGTDPTDIGSI